MTAWAAYFDGDSKSKLMIAAFYSPSVVCSCSLHCSSITYMEFRAMVTNRDVCTNFVYSFHLIYIFCSSFSNNRKAQRQKKRK